MKIRVSEAKLIQLDWLVAKCLGFNENVLDPFNWLHVAYPMGCYAYSRNWEVGGQVIEREHIGVWPPWPDKNKKWDAIQYDLPTPVSCSGPTPLIAAMRCYVVSKLGEEVDIPSELGVST